MAEARRRAWAKLDGATAHWARGLGVTAFRQWRHATRAYKVREELALSLLPSVSRNPTPTPHPTMLTVLTHSLRASQRERLGVLASGLHYAGTLALRAFRAWHGQAR